VRRQAKPTFITRKVTVTMKQYQVALLLIAISTILNIASPTLAARDDQTGDCIKKGKCKD